MTSVPSDRVKVYLQHPTIHDFLALIILYDKIVPEPARSKGLQEVKQLFDVRMSRNKHYYQKQQKLIAIYRFVREILDKLTNSSD